MLGGRAVLAMESCTVECLKEKDSQVPCSHQGDELLVTEKSAVTVTIERV